MNGLSEEDTLDIRSNTIADPKLSALANLTGQLASHKGKPGDSAVEDFFSAGYNKAAFAELIAVVALTTITNTVYGNGDFEIDFPKAQNIETQNA